MGLEIIAGGTSPAWIYDAGATPISFTKSGATRVMPNPWDTVFQAKWGAFLSALGAAFDGETAVAYITMSGMGASTETIMPPTSGFDAGNLAQWETASAAIVDLYASAFPHTPFSVALNSVIAGTDTTSTTDALVDHGKNKAPGLFGTQYQGLNATATTTSSPDGPFNAEVLAFSTLSSPGFQMVCSAVDPSVCKAQWINGTLDGGSGGDSGALPGALADSLVAGANLGAHWIEVYGSDCDVAANASALATARTMLRANAGL